jgi:hypothetical protein
MKMMVHINKFELKKGKKGKPWTIHTSRGCTPAKEVLIDGTSSAQCFLERKTNPKCFVIVEGDMKRIGKDRYVLTAREKGSSRKLGKLNPNSREAGLLHK